MDSHSIDEISNLPRSSSSCSLPSSLGLYEPSTYTDIQICPVDATDEDEYVVLQDPIHQETNYQPLVICDTWCDERNRDNDNLANFSNTLDEQLQSSIWCEVPLDREGLSDRLQYPEALLMGTQSETHMQVIQTLERELYFWKKKSCHLMVENNGAISKARMLEKQMMELKLENQYLMNCNFHSTSQACELRNKVDDLELKDARRDLLGVETRFGELNDQMADIEDEFTELKNEVKQFMERFFSPKTKVTETLVGELKEAVIDFQDFWYEFKEFWAELRRDMRELKSRAAELELRNTFSNNSVAALVMDLNDQDVQIAQTHERVGRLDRRLVRLEKLMEILNMEVEEETMEQEEAGSVLTSEADKSKLWQVCLVECMRLCKQSLLNCRLFKILKLAPEK